jgi:hypothetical protein
MPSCYRLPGYIGNALLALFGLAVLFQPAPGFLVGLFMIALAGLNLYLVWKLDTYSSEESWLALDLVKAKLRQEIDEVKSETRGAVATDGDASTPPAHGHVSVVPNAGDTQPSTEPGPTSKT